MKKRFTEEQIVRILQEAQAGMSAQDVCRKHNITEQSFYRWPAKYGTRTSVSQASEGTKAREHRAEEDHSLPGARHSDAQRRELKKVLSLLKRLRAASYLHNAYTVSERRACEVLNLHRSTYRYRHRQGADAAHQEVVRFAALRLLGLSEV